MTPAPQFTGEETVLLNVPVYPTILHLMMSPVLALFAFCACACHQGRAYAGLLARQAHPN